MNRMARAYTVTITYVNDEEVKLSALRVGCRTNIPPNRVIYKCLPGLALVLSQVSELSSQLKKGNIFR